MRAAALVERPAKGGATVGAAALVEHQRMGLPPTAGSVADTDSEGGVFLAGVRSIGNMRSYVGLKGRETQPPGGDGRWYVVMWR